MLVSIYKDALCHNSKDHNLDIYVVLGVGAGGGARRIAMLLVTCCPISRVGRVQKGAKFDLTFEIK